jgi:pyruvate/2-oxoglutarate dehydrogenase complex dihydrolipoamide acyltransferase (E2) component
MVKAASYKVINASNIEVVAPPGVAGWQDVIVTLAVGRAVALGGYRYEAPVTPPPGQVVIQSAPNASAMPAAANSTAPLARASVSSVRLAANGTMSVSMKVAGAAKGQTVSLYKSGTKVRSGKVTKNGTVAFAGVAPTTGTYTVVLSKAGKTMSRSQPVLITAPRR